MEAASQLVSSGIESLCFAAAPDPPPPSITIHSQPTTAVDDLSSILTIYNIVGVQFLERLLRTGMGKGSVNENREAYLQPSVTVLAAFCRVPEIAASNEMVTKIPLVLEVLTQESGPAVLEECFEFLFLVSTSSEDGMTTLYSFGVMKILASHMPSLPGSDQMKIAMKLVQLLVNKFYPEPIINEYLPELSIIAPLYDSPRGLPDKNWPNYMVMIEGSGKTWKQDQRVRLQHVHTGIYLHSHDKKYQRIAGGQQEATLFPEIRTGLFNTETVERSSICESYEDVPPAVTRAERVRISRIASTWKFFAPLRHIRFLTHPGLVGTLRTGVVMPMSKRTTRKEAANKALGGMSTKRLMIVSAK